MDKTGEVICSAWWSPAAKWWMIAHSMLVDVWLKGRRRGILSEIKPHEHRHCVWLCSNVTTLRAAVILRNCLVIPERAPFGASRSDAYGETPVRVLKSTRYEIRRQIQLLDHGHGTIEQNGKWVTAHIPRCIGEDASTIFRRQYTTTTRNASKWTSAPLSVASLSATNVF